MSAVATLPHLEIQLDGEAIPDKTVSTLEEVRVQHRLSQPSACELTFFVPGDPVADLRNFTAGSSVRLVDVPSQGLLFSGEITALEYSYEPAHGQVFRVRCYDKLHRLRKRQPVRAHVQVTVAELARELVRDLGLAVNAQRDGPLSQRLIQSRQSDWDLLVDVSRRFGLYLTLQDDVLHLVTLEGVADAIPLELGKTLLEARVRVNAEAACRSVVAKGWNVARVEPHESRAAGAVIGREVDAEASPELFGSNGERTLTNEALPDDSHADAVAQAELDLRAAREVTLSGVAEGNADLKPGTRVKVSGIRGDLAGSYVLTSITHLVNRRTGFVSEIGTEPPALEQRASSPMAVWGTITSVDDPDHLGRVKASLPTLGNVETDWMGVMAAGAGGGKGFVVLPDVGDQVLILFLDGATAQGIVLGGLYGVNGPSDYGIEDARVQRFSLGTPGGQMVKLDDTSKCLRLENGSGSFVELSPLKVLVSSVADLEIAAPGRSIVIRGKTIDFRQA